MPLASLNRCSENIFIKPIIIAELKFRDVQREIFLADFVERADHTALNQRPEAFDCIGKRPRSRFDLL